MRFIDRILEVATGARTAAAVAALAIGGSLLFRLSPYDAPKAHLIQRSNRESSGWRLVVLLPVALLATDLLENPIIFIGVGAFPDRVAVVAALPVVTAAKLGAATATFVSAVVLALLSLRTRLSRSQ